MHPIFPVRPPSQKTTARAEDKSTKIIFLNKFLNKEVRPRLKDSTGYSKSSHKRPSQTPNKFQALVAKQLVKGNYTGSHHSKYGESKTGNKTQSSTQPAAGDSLGSAGMEGKELGRNQTISLTGLKQPDAEGVEQEQNRAPAKNEPNVDGLDQPKSISYSKGNAPDGSPQIQTTEPEDLETGDTTSQSLEANQVTSDFQSTQSSSASRHLSTSIGVGTGSNSWFGGFGLFQRRKALIDGRKSGEDYAKLFKSSREFPEYPTKAQKSGQEEFMSIAALCLIFVLVSIIMIFILTYLVIGY